MSQSISSVTIPLPQGDNNGAFDQKLCPGGGYDRGLEVEKSQPMELIPT